MSRRINILFAGLLLAGQLFAAVVSPEEAQQIAQNYIGQQKSYNGYRSPSQRMQLKATRLKNNSDELAYYVFGAEEGGFVLVSADDRLRPVIGHAYRGYYDEQHFPENMREWLDYLTEQISNLPDTYFAGPRKQKHYTEVEPLLDKIEWNQGEPYNNDCPSVDGKKCPTGCVATAAAQIMKYYEYPEKGRGSHQYKWGYKGDTTVLSANFNHYYDWDNMLASYKEGGYSQTEADAVSQLMSDLGIAFNMGYAPGGSGANEYVAARAMVEYFKYDSAAQVISMDLIGAEKFEEKVAKELKFNRPVMMSGRSDSDSGHEFVCDGVNSDDLFHINWGWGGRFNGDFALTAMYPDGQGIGGALDGEGYTHNVSAVIGIKPDKGNSPVPQLMLSSITVREGVAEVGRNESFTLQLDTFINRGLFPWSGYFGYLIYDENDDIIDTYYLYSSEMLELNPLSYYSYIYFASVPVSNNVPNGEYRIVPAFTPSLTNKEWTPICLTTGEVAGLDIRVTSSSVIFTGMQEEKEQAEKYIGELSMQKMGQESMRFKWTAPTLADHYVVSVYAEDSGQRYLFSTDTVSDSKVTVQFYYPAKLTYIWSVRAFDSNNKRLAEKYGEEFVVEVTTDYSPYRLKHEVQEDGILFSWAGEAPAYQFELAFDGQVVVRQSTTDTKYFIPYKADGLYEWSVRSLCQSQLIYISNAVNASFSLPSDQGLEETLSDNNTSKYIQNGQLYIRKNDNIYDVLGR
ncbi:MAG: C10 family peptidase [Paludibacteraceae bacterium]|nr:C10 family peptidase [Paludibacteraceae bacterium]